MEPPVMPLLNLSHALGLQPQPPRGFLVNTGSLHSWVRDEEGG